MATSGVLGGGGYQGRYLEFAWSLVSQDIAGNTSTIYWRVTVVVHHHIIIIIETMQMHLEKF